MSAHTQDGFGTRLIHVGSEPDPVTGAVIPPMSLSTTFKQDAPGVYKGYDYSRSDNPNRRALELLLASIESGGGRGITYASGSAATASLLQSLGPGAHVLSIDDVYGGTNRYMRRVAQEVQGLVVDFVDLANATDDEILSHITPATKLIWVESPTNPTLRLVDLPNLVRLARSTAAQPLVLVDNTFLSPFYASPLKMGADIVLHSMTKYINGHSDVVMGALVFPPPSTSTPRDVRLAALHDRARFIQNAFGAVPSAHDAWLLQRGAKTLHLRMAAHGQSALAIAHALENSQHVQSVAYPGLRSSPYHTRARAVVEASEGGSRLLSKLPPSDSGIPFGGVLSFWLRGGERETRRFLSRLRLFALAESLGGVESLAEAPAVMTHASVPREQRERLGIDDAMIRLSVGVEEVEDLVADVLQALEWAVEREASASAHEGQSSGESSEVASEVGEAETPITSVESLVVQEKK